MKIEFSDYNNAESVIADVWPEIETAIDALELHVKGSDQAGIQGNLIFDPVGSNRALKDKLEPSGWSSGVPIPQQFKSLGTDIDFEKDGVILEVQFSNYPFLLNNVVRSYLFSKQDVQFNGVSPKALIVITKCKVFPASNSTLYYEQGKEQLDALSLFDVFDLPIRLIGLSEDVGSRVPCKYTTYSASRYSRTVLREEAKTCYIAGNGARAKLEVD